MRSSEARACSGLADAGRRTSKTLKLRLAKQLPGLLLPCTAGEAPAQPQAPPSLLYSQQLWAAAGQLQQRLQCSREVYFPGLVVQGPVEKQVPADTGVETHQGKRAKLAGGQYRRSFRDAPCDSTPPDTPYKPSKQQQHVEEQQQHTEHVQLPGVSEVRLPSQADASTSSSSSYEPGQPHRQSTSGVAVAEEECSFDWPLLVPNKQKRSSRRRRSLWQHWPPLLQDCGNLISGVAAADAAAGSAAGQRQQQVLLTCGLQQLVMPMQLDEQQPVQVVAAGVEQPAPSALHRAQQCAVREIAAAFPSKAAASSAADAKAVAAACGDVSPGHETSQMSEMTVCRDSPRAAAGAVLSSWPSSSTESDCQAHMHEFGGVHKAAAVAAAATAAAAGHTAGAAGKRLQAARQSITWPLSDVYQE